ncbi:MULTISPECIES: zinc-binding alcohol dehydrogenase [unclassified Thioalkalivibrio]|uniref:zinc-dependent alcohol dehydrogenase n=1 Tax=unclassified Thioalkalivibrio TaxID=2621013 RepID=UPI000376FD90|nr:MULTISPECIES: zinc-binding alcohol dehydrogenase [unclassified Thioalkalivibrio]
MSTTNPEEKAFWVTGPGSGELRPEALAEPGPGEVRVRTQFTAISRGTEALVFHGRVPESQYQAMRAPFQAGDFPWPVKYGYISVGTVEAGGEAEGLAGQRVFCLHPHQSAYVVPAAAVVPVPDEVPSARAVLAANMETAINAVWDLQPGPGDRIAVIGAGVVGLLVAWLLRGIPGTRVTLIDSNPGRETVATALGLEIGTPDAARENPGLQGLDAVVHASGNPAGLEQALALAGVEARVVEMSWYGDQPVPAPLGEAFHSRRLTLRSSQVGRIPPERAARWDYRRRLELALSLLAEPALDALITSEDAFADLPAAMARVTGPEAGRTLCHRIRY